MLKTQCITLKVGVHSHQLHIELKIHTFKDKYENYVYESVVFKCYYVKP